MSERYYYDIVEDKLWMKQPKKFKLIKPYSNGDLYIVSLRLANNSITNKSYERLKRLAKGEPVNERKEFTKQTSMWRDQIDFKNCIQLIEIDSELSDRYYYDFVEDKLWMKQPNKYKLIKPYSKKYKLYLFDNLTFVNKSCSRIRFLVDEKRKKN